MGGEGLKLSFHRYLSKYRFIATSLALSDDERQVELKLHLNWCGCDSIQTQCFVINYTYNICCKDAN